MTIIVWLFALLWQDGEEENDKYNHMQDFEQQRSNSVKTTFTTDSVDEAEEVKNDNNASRFVCTLCLLVRFF